jgi:membrane fusion protein, multidrug efflux system
MPRSTPAYSGQQQFPYNILSCVPVVEAGFSIAGRERLMMKRVWIAGVVIVGLVALGTGYQALVTQEARSQTRTEPAPERPPVPVIVAFVKSRPMPVEFTAVGTAQTIASVAVKSRVDGQISEVLVKDGQEVTVGEPIMTLDPRLAQAQLHQTEAQLARDRAQLDNARRDVARYKPLAAKQFLSRQQFDAATTTAAAAAASVQSDEASVESARVTLSYYTIRSPLNGRIGYVSQKIGNNVKANDVPLATINQIKPIYVGFPLPQMDLPAVRKAMAAHPVVVTALPAGNTGATEQGRLAFFENNIDASTGTILMRAIFDNLRERLWPGEFCNVTVQLSTQPDALTVPSGAVQVGQNGNYVYVVTADDRAEYRAVTVDRTIGGVSVVSKGLTVGERVITDGQLRITNGSRVTIHGGGDVPKPENAS